MTNKTIIEIEVDEFLPWNFTDYLEFRTGDTRFRISENECEGLVVKEVGWFIK